MAKTNNELYIPDIQKSVTGGNTFSIEKNDRTVGNYGGSSYNPNQNNTTEPQTVAEQIAGSSNPELELRQYLYQTDLENIFTDYQKYIAGLDKARQKDIADAYFVREMSKKYIGEYASNAGIGDVSGNLIDIYGKYAENLTDINASYSALESSYEAKMLKDSRETSTALLKTEVALEMSEYADTILSAQTDISKGIQTGDWGDFDNYEDYIDSLDLPDKYKQELMDWAEGENNFFEQTSFVQIQGSGVNQTDLERFGLTAQPYLDLSYYTNEDVMSGVAYVQNGVLFGVSDQATDIPASELEGFNYRKDGNGFIAYKGDTYVYMTDGTFHKMVSIGMSVKQENGIVDGAIVTKTNIGKVNVMINGVEYVVGSPDSNFSIDNLTDAELLRMGINPDRTLIEKSTPDQNKVVFYNGRYSVLYFENGNYIGFSPLVKKE